MSADDSDPTADRWPRPRLVSFAAGGMVVWLGGELLLRRGGVPLLGNLVGSARGADMILVGIGFPLLALGIAVWGLRAGIAPVAWRYDWSFRSIVAGFGGIVAYFVPFALFAVVYAQTVGVPSTPASLVSETMPRWVLVLLFLVNGFIGPISEELAWRGVIQTALVREYGASLGIGAPAAAFVAKHLVVDMAVPGFRAASLIIIAVVLGLVRHRYGTASSTVTHVGINLAATAIATV